MKGEDCEKKWKKKTGDDTEMTGIDPIEIEGIVVPTRRRKNTGEMVAAVIGTAAEIVGIHTETGIAAGIAVEIVGIHTETEIAAEIVAIHTRTGIAAGRGIAAEIAGILRKTGIAVERGSEAEIVGTPTETGIAAGRETEIAAEIAGIQRGIEIVETLIETGITGETIEIAMAKTRIRTEISPVRPGH